MSTRRPLSSERKEYLREVKRGVRDAYRDLKAIDERDCPTLSVIDSVKDADAVLAAALATPSSHQGHSDFENNSATIMRAAEALADHATILRESHPVESICLQLAGLSLVRSLQTIVRTDDDDDQLRRSLRPFDDLPHGEISSWLKERIAQARMIMSEQIQPAQSPTAVAV